MSVALPDEPAGRLELDEALELVAAVRRACRTGQALNLAAGGPDADLNPTAGADWPAARRVPAELIRTVLLDPDLRPDPHGLQLRGVALTGLLDLTRAVLPCPLVMVSSYFEQPPALSHVAMPVLALTGCCLPGLILDGARIDGALLLDKLTVHGAVRAIGAHITGPLALRGATLINPAGIALALAGVRIDGDLFLQQLTADGEVQALGAHITGRLEAQSATLTNPSGTALKFDGVRIDGGASFGQLTAYGEVRALARALAANSCLRARC